MAKSATACVLASNSLTRLLMPREITITMPSPLTDDLVSRLRTLSGVIGISVQRGASVQPPGDVVTLAVTEEGLHGSMAVFDEQKLGRHDDVSLHTSEPLSLVSRTFNETVLRGPHHSTWEEMELTTARESTMTVNAMIVMFVAGVLAAVGIAQNAVHVVIGAMAIAPGFLPIVRTMAGVTARDRSWWHGLVDLVKGYASLVLSAAAAAVALQALGINPLGGEATYLESGTLTRYWTTISIPSLLASSAAAVAGVILLATGRSILTSGVMIALALVPTAALVGIGTVAGDGGVVAASLLRWAVDVVLVAVAAAVIFAWKRSTIYRRRSALAAAADS